MDRRSPDARLRALLAGLAALALATASQAAGGGNPRLLYTLHCSGCHLPDGSGAPARGIPSMRGSVGNFLRLPEGRALLVQVPGVMNTPLDDEQVAKLMNWLLRDMAGPSMPPDAPPYTASEVKSLRRTRPADMAANRARLADRLAAMGYPVEAALPSGAGDSEPPKEQFK